MNLGRHSLQTAVGPWRAGAHVAVASPCSAFLGRSEAQAPLQQVSAPTCQGCLRPGHPAGKAAWESGLVHPGFAWCRPVGVQEAPV